MTLDGASTGLFRPRPKSVVVLGFGGEDDDDLPGSVRSTCPVTNTTRTGVGEAFGHRVVDHKVGGRLLGTISSVSRRGCPGKGGYKCSPLLMDCGVRCGAITAMEASPAASAVAARVGGGRLRLTVRGSVRFPSGFGGGFQDVVKFRCRKGKSISIASAESNKCESRCVSTPLVPQSPAGKFLGGILNDHPHIFPVAAAEQLENLASERDGAVARRAHSVGSAQACLHERIAEMKEGECQIAVEEVMYMLIVHQFSKIKVPMFPHLSRLMGGSLDSCPSYEDELESIYDHESLEMVKIHLLNILGRTGTFDATMNQSRAQIKRLQLGRIYAASIMYGYFLKSACLRHHLEYLFSLTSKDYPLSYLIQMPSVKHPQYTKQRHPFGPACTEDDASYPSYSQRRPRRIKNLRSYVMKFDPNSLQICARLKSRESVNLIEKHSRALFLDKAGQNLEDEPVSVTYSSLKHLVLEAVMFGSFLWDVERYVDSVYGLSEH
ncbi:unnamed protein product [Spirodela intermedia]|uniref:Uncharacterized protein n=1 Tax=Spirodela intermedia TaxID=51605 RepID=A0A7I8KS06_SPIIN|nr:unnamed protein product [Spirodela intermedia]